MSLGIDPGWKNLGIALVNRREDGKLALLTSLTLNPSEMGEYPARDILSAPFHKIDNDYEKVGWLNHISIERYVSYQNVNTAEAENILMLIGMLREAGVRAHCSGFTSCDILLTRAIDWKMEAVKLLFKLRGFKNPSDKLDKKFSVAAAKACLDIEPTFKTDHEADSIVLAALPYLREELKARNKETKNAAGS